MSASMGSVICAISLLPQSIVGRRSGVDRRADLLHQAEIVPMVPDLGDPGPTEAEQVDSRELSPLARRLDSAPRPGKGPARRPASRDEVALGQHQVDTPVGVW